MTSKPRAGSTARGRTDPCVVSILSTSSNKSEERVKVNCRWSGTNLQRVRVLGAGVVLLAAGCSVLLWGSRPRQSAQNVPSMISGLGTDVSPINSVVASAHDSNLPSVTSFSHLPLMFEPNVGQADPSVKFLARGAGYSLFLNSEGAVLALQHGHDAAHPARNIETVAMKLVGADFGASVRGADNLPGKTNYFLGNDPAKWLHNVPQFARVQYDNVYSGINLVFYGNQGRLEYDFQVAPGADPGQAELEFDGSTPVELSNGNLILKGDADGVRFEAPRVYQQLADRQQSAQDHFLIRPPTRTRFKIGPYDHTRELTIDPVLSSGFSTYFGGTGNETSPSIAVDSSHNVYLAGSTTSPVNTFPQPAAASTLIGTNPNVFVAKLDPSGTSVTYLTFLGGGGSDSSVAVALDGACNAYIARTPTSRICGPANFPTT